MPETVTFAPVKTEEQENLVLEERVKYRLPLRYILIVALVAIVVLFFLVRWLLPPTQQAKVDDFLGFMLTPQFWMYAGVGFAAQIIDGALGMAYGVSSTTFLLSIGLTPAAASASVHMAEVCTSGVSGLSHWHLGNVKRALFRSLVIPGAIGAIIGATILSNMDGDRLKPWIALYLLVMGIIIIRKAIKKHIEKREVKNIAPLALFGGFIDAIGGGGWGPVVNSTLIGRGHDPRFSIGSVNTAEFFVALAGSITFTVFNEGLSYFYIVAGLILGGVFAAPLAAVLAKRIAPRYLMFIVGGVIILLSVRTFYKEFF